jgi:hypothetical protein
LKLKCDGQLSNVAFKFNLRRYNLGMRDAGDLRWWGVDVEQPLDSPAGAAPVVGRCRLTL